MGSTRRKFTPEYKTEAVQFVITSGQPIAEVARIWESSRDLGELGGEGTGEWRFSSVRWSCPSGPSWTAP